MSAPTAATAPAPAPLGARRRPAWSRLGGGGVLLAAALLLVATVLEYLYWEVLDQPVAVLVPFVVCFSLSLLLYFAASFPLAFGSTGDNGIVGRSVAGKAGFIGFGVFILAAQTIYLLSVYFTDQGSDLAAADTASLVLMLLQYAAAIVAGVAVLRAGVATGFARWSLLAMLVIGIVCGAVANSTEDYAVVTIAYLISTIAQLLVGISYLRSGTRAGAASA